MKKSIALVALAASFIAVAGCVPVPMYDEQSMYNPGGALADKHQGPMVLSGASEATVNAMFPKGTPKSQVMQVLGAPTTNSSSSEGTSSQLYSHTFTSYRRKQVQSEALMVQYDKNNTVSALNFSTSNSSW
ncbi:hypothetical protein [Azospirillum canadense]|uniref:hypothetical protein n=1 Tax=Azospirillum canadense TaxID=403962 RepID=UPI002227468D|nr:hypothetical protein [Azospirillum canadense]MCW2237694.1 outer membrane protein assembly factor BamE (lipoprotein component of BamABCDE complex) [Azospirillum canadense]